MKRPPALNRAVTSGFSRFGGERAAKLLPQGRLAGPMPWIIAIMVALTVVAAAGGLALSNMASNARAELEGGATVQIVEPVPAEREKQADAVEAALAEDPQVTTLRRVPEEEIDALLEPWLGVAVDSDTVPVPALIDVRLRSEASHRNIADLQARLAAVAPSARVDAQSSWLGPVFSAIASLQWLSLALIFLLGVTSVAAVWLASRTALGTNRPTVEIVHLLGGTDGQIARIFQRSVGFDATLGGAVGLALGLVAVLLIGRQFDGLGSGMVAGGGLDWLDWLFIACIPLLGIGVAILTARMTVMAALRKML